MLILTERSSTVIFRSIRYTYFQLAVGIHDELTESLLYRTVMTVLNCETILLLDHHDFVTMVALIRMSHCEHTSTSPL